MDLQESISSLFMMIKIIMKFIAREQTYVSPTRVSSILTIFVYEIL